MPMFTKRTTGNSVRISYIVHRTSHVVHVAHRFAVASNHHASRT